MRGCITLLVLVGMAGTAIAMIGASFIYCLALVVVWLVLITFSKVFGRKEEDAEQEDDTTGE